MVVFLAFSFFLSGLAGVKSNGSRRPNKPRIPLQLKHESLVFTRGFLPRTRAESVFKLADLSAVLSWWLFICWFWWLLDVWVCGLDQTQSLVLSISADMFDRNASGGWAPSRRCSDMDNGWLRIWISLEVSDRTVWPLGPARLSTRTDPAVCARRDGTADVILSACHHNEVRTCRRRRVIQILSKYLAAPSRLSARPVSASHSAVAMSSRPPVSCCWRPSSEAPLRSAVGGSSAARCRFKSLATSLMEGKKEKRLLDECVLW